MRLDEDQQSATSHTAVNKTDMDQNSQELSNMASDNTAITVNTSDDTNFHNVELNVDSNISNNEDNDVIDSVNHGSLKSSINKASVKRQITWNDQNTDPNKENHMNSVQEISEVQFDITNNDANNISKLPNSESPKIVKNGGEAKEKSEKSENGVTDFQSDAQWLQWVQDEFTNIAGDEGHITYKKFKSALRVRESFFADRFFDFFDKDGDDKIQLFELMDGLRTLTRGSTTDKIRFLFKLYDLDGNGYIDIDELKTVLQSCVNESSLKMSQLDVDRLTEVLFDSADTDCTGEITFEKLEQVLLQHPGVMENLTISAAEWLKPNKGEKKRDLPRYLQSAYLINNLKKIISFVIFFLVNIGLYAFGCYNYWTSNVAIIIARGSGMCLNFNCMFVLVLMLRKCITWLRTWQWAYFVLPLDQHILFHKATGIMIALHSFIHTAGHIGNAVIMSDTTNMTVAEVIFTTKANYGWVYGSAPITGVILVVILAVMVICSMSFVRRSGHFEVFYYTHMLYIPFWILCIIHATNFWKWFILPGVIFFVESILRSKPMKLATHGRTFIKEVRLLPSGVTHLVISRPPSFDFKPGDYLFIQIPVLAKYEWHPFTISSAPEMEGYIWLHIRSAGHWTKSLYEFFDKYGTSPQRKSTLRGTINKAFHDGLDKIEKGIKEVSSTLSSRHSSRKHSRKGTVRRRKDTTKKVNIEVYLDGPYGTCTREIFQTEHAVLIGSGIGITPYASILQSIIYRFNAIQRTCPSCQHVFNEPCVGSLMKLKKVDFVWINRDQISFEWFTSLLTQLELEQLKLGSPLDKILHLHMYMTAAVQKADMKGIGLQVALDLIHEKEQRDLLTGLRTRTKPGRPDFNELFKKIDAQKHGKVKVFFCGAPVVGKTIKEHCAKYKFGFRKETF